MSYGTQGPQFSIDPWIVARDRYLDSLDEEDKNLFKDASLENMLYATSVAQKDHERSSKLRAAHQRLQPFFAAIVTYGRALDVYSSASQAVLAPIWGSVRLLLRVGFASTKFISQFRQKTDLRMSGSKRVRGILR